MSRMGDYFIEMQQRAIELGHDLADSDDDERRQSDWESRMSEEYETALSHLGIPFSNNFDDELPF